MKTKLLHLRGLLKSFFNLNSIQRQRLKSKKEVQSLKKKKVNEMTHKPTNFLEVESLTENFVKEINTSNFLRTRVKEQALSV